MSKEIFPEMRKDPTSGRWSVVAKEGSTEEEKRKSRYKKSVKYLDRQRIPLESKACPFSRSYSGGRRQEKNPIFGLRWDGDEVKIVWHEKLEERKKQWYSDNWEIMILEHDYAQVNRYITPKLFDHGPFVSVAGYGIHDLIIEDPTEEHKPLGVMPWKRTMLLFLAMLYRLRGDLGLETNLPCFPKVDSNMFIPLSKTEGIRHVSFFHNYLKEAGASEEHPHSQIIASPIIPTDVSAELAYVRKRYNEPPGRCIYCQVIETERNLNKRVLFENDSFLAIHPYAPVYPFEIWILPKTHNSSFDTIIPKDYSLDKPNPLMDFAQIVNDVVGRLYVSLRNPSYNLILKTEPILRDGERPYIYHWHIRVEPRDLYKPAGLEMGTGIFCCETPPEEAVEFLQKWGALTEKVDTPNSLKWYIKEIGDLTKKLEGEGSISDDIAQTIWEATNILEILPNEGQNIQDGLELKARLREIIKKYPQLKRSPYQHSYKTEKDQKIHSLSREFEETDGPHYRSDPSTDRWVLVPSKKRRKKTDAHAKAVAEWRTQAFKGIYCKMKKNKDLVDKIKKFKRELKLLKNANSEDAKKKKEEIKKAEKEKKEEEKKLHDSLSISPRDNKDYCPFCEKKRTEENKNESEKNKPVFGLKAKQDDSIAIIKLDKYWDKKETWDIFVIENRYPIFSRQEDTKQFPFLKGSGPFQQIEGKGICDLIVIGDGSKNYRKFKININNSKPGGGQSFEIHHSIGKFKDKTYTKLVLYAIILRLGGQASNDLEVTDKSNIISIRQSHKEIPGPAIKHFTIFSNYGKDAGARYAHPTWQIIGTPIIPTDIMRELAHSKAYYDENSGRCCFCDMIAAELNLAQKEKEEKEKDDNSEEKTDNRIIYPTDPTDLDQVKFIVLAPFAARVPFELIILPRDHQSNLQNMTKEQVYELSNVLYMTLKALSDILNDPHYSLVIKNAPIPPKGQENLYDHYHWRIVIEPQRLAIPAGYEHLTGIWSNPTPPEEYAEVLRKKIAE